jgi:hypothetical protein
MTDLTEKEKQDRAIKALMRANSALSRVFNTDEGEGDGDE